MLGNAVIIAVHIVIDLLIRKEMKGSIKYKLGFLHHTPSKKTLVTYRTILRSKTGPMPTFLEHTLKSRILNGMNDFTLKVSQSRKQILKFSFELKINQKYF